MHRPGIHGWAAELKNDDGSYKSYKHIHNWIRDIRADGLDYEIDVLESFDLTDDVRDRLNEAERFFIAYWRYIGADLLNVTDGGDGGNLPGERNSFYGKKHRPETIEANRRAHLGKRTKGTTGMKLSEATRVKMRGPRPHTTGKNHPMFGKKHSEETRQKISAKGNGRKHSPETIEKMKAARTAYWEAKRNGRA